MNDDNKYEDQAPLERYSPNPPSNDYLIDGMDYFYRKDFVFPRIIISKESDYDPLSETSYNEAERENKITLKLIFESDEELNERINSKSNDNQKNTPSISFSENKEVIEDKYENIRRSLLETAQQKSYEEYYDKLETYKAEKDYEYFLNESIKELDDQSIKELMNLYKKMYENNEITEEEYKMKLEELQNKVINFNNMLYNDKYIKAIEIYNKNIISRLANNEKYKNQINSVNKIYDKITKNKKDKLTEISDENERFLKYFGGFL